MGLSYGQLFDLAPATLRTVGPIVMPGRFAAVALAGKRQAGQHHRATQQLDAGDGLTQQRRFFQAVETAGSITWTGRPVRRTGAAGGRCP